MATDEDFINDDASSTANGNGGGTHLLEMSDITKDFPGGRVLHGVDFRVRAGQVHALVGENGAGKSTLMKILAGVYPDYGGDIRVDGRPVAMRTPRAALDQGVAVIYQEFALAPDLSVADNVALGREQSGRLPGTISHKQDRQRSAEEAAALQIDLPMDAPVRELSVAEQQLTEIVKAVSRQARLLVMEEPTARLSGAERDRLFTIIRRLAERGVGVVYISHFLEEIFAIASHVSVLRDGHLVTHQPLADLNIERLARLMVGEKYREIERSTDRHLDHDVGTSDEALVLEGVGVQGLVHPTDLRLRRGEVVGIAGLQGAGRTDLAEALIGNRPGSFGRIRTPGYAGALPRSPDDAMRIGIALLPADRKRSGILGARPLSENIVISSLRRRELSAGPFIRARRRRAVVDDMMGRFAVRPRNPGMEIRSLSGGNQQKVIFARAAAARADVLILDQPTAGVDVGAKVELYEQVDALAESGVAILVISDDLSELLRLADSIVFMREGLLSEPRPAADFDRASLLAAITGKARADPPTEHRG